MAKMANGDNKAAEYAWERHCLNGELNRWGGWIERHSDYEGYPGVNILVAFLQGRGGGGGGHRVLCLDMPWDIYATHARVLICTEAEQEALWIKYVIRMKDDGTFWTIEERLLRMGLSDDTFRRRLSRARQRILGVNPDDLEKVLK